MDQNTLLQWLYIAWDYIVSLLKDFLPILPFIILIVIFLPWIIKTFDEHVREIVREEMGNDDEDEDY